MCLAYLTKPFWLLKNHPCSRAYPLKLRIHTSIIAHFGDFVQGLEIGEILGPMSLVLRVGIKVEAY